MHILATFPFSCLQPGNSRFGIMSLKRKPLILNGETKPAGNKSPEVHTTLSTILFILNMPLQL